MDCPIDALTMGETLEIIDKSISQRKGIRHVVINAAKIVNMRRDYKLRESISSCDIINPDGQSIVWASRVLGKSIPERISGIDLMQSVVKLAQKKNYKIFFLGASEDIVNRVVKKYSSIYSSSIIAGYRNGYFKEADEIDIVNEFTFITEVI